ncbi:DEAD/DEAH box helicase [Bosea vaviloviae]|uniref:Helicase n=1 Tax=Bosea vaviloviae TaxID=1526658 RepID=A0A0N1F341_9HYPH|nr:helicase C-terminal domain-containing protein [Bosea vaviloviae]KPH79408.1 hypothetical protein AE618_19235 [Bosea vaviloviae]
MTLERFQEATVEAAVEALTRQGGSRRFLIADEVGLGKTVSARAIASELQRQKGRALNVVYLCPNLDIASQNLGKLMALQENWPRPEDRLSLVLGKRPSSGRTDYRIYSYTPETSLPGWKPGQRTGRTAERDLIGSLLLKAAPTAWREIRAFDRARDGSKRRLFGPNLGEPPSYVKRPFEAALRELMGLERKKLDLGLQERLARWKDPLPEIILRCRAALAMAALRDPLIRPDLLILDEFHRYADLVMPTRAAPPDPHAAELHHIQRKLVEALVGKGENSPALLLLSATPYRLHRLDQGAIPGDRYGHFIGLVRFLHGAAGSSQGDRAESAIRAHHSALARRDDKPSALAEVGEAKRELEAALRPVIARTERATAISGEVFDRRVNEAVVEPGDLVTFRHLAHSVAKTKGAMRSWVQPLWSSVPYPAETLFNYNICKALNSDLPASTIASGKERPAHPHLRALVDNLIPKASTIDLDALTLPWLAPTRPWWTLGGRWGELASKGRLHGKSLLFSRYKGTPTAVAAWLSGEVDRRSEHRRDKGKTAAFLRPTAKAPWPLVALFMPFPTLSLAFEPVRGGNLGLDEVRRRARAELEKWLRSKGISVAPADGAPRKPWRLAFDLEQAVGAAPAITAALRQLRKLVEPNSWLRKTPTRSATKAEIIALADWMLGAPGIVVARTLRRHEPDVTRNSDRTMREFRFAWGQLRPYLGQRQFAASMQNAKRLRRTGGYPEALRQAVLDGGLEATLDEHVAVTKLVGSGGALDILEKCIVGRPGRVQRRTTRGLRSARVHAAVPYLGAERRNDRSKDNRKMRSDILREGFNSPFWPHVLATTSIGQEGLDFHVWCDRVVHWDLPRNAVDFEQREGRISRYASLPVRRALAERYGGAASAPWSSPFQAIFDTARVAKRDGLGLERWWSPAGHNPTSVTFSMPFSLGGLRLKRLQDELVNYRLALGQPEPHLFEAMIEHFELPRNEARRLALNLSPAVSIPL